MLFRSPTLDQGRDGQSCNQTWFSEPNSGSKTVSGMGMFNSCLWLCAFQGGQVMQSLWWESEGLHSDEEKIEMRIQDKGWPCLSGLK